jgi:HK97 family phage major capsid protein
VLTPFVLLLGVLALAALLVALADHRPLTFMQRLRLLSMSLRLDTGELNPGPTSTELREKCREAADKLLNLRSTPADKRGDDFAVQLRDAATELHDFDALEQRTSRDEQRAFEQLVWDQAVADHEARAADPNQRGSRGPTAAGAETGEHRTAGQMFVESDAYTQRGSHNIGETEVRNLLTGSSIGTSGSDNLALIGQPYLHTPSLRRRRFFVRDLMSVETTGLQVIPYVQELNALTNETGAGTVMEASAKPEVTMQFTPAEAPVRKIAAWVQVTEEAFADAPTLRAYVDSRLAYMLLVEEEDQLINGNGTAPNISGILDQTGLQTQAAVDNDLAATIGLAAGKVENVDGSFDGTAINPITYWEGVVERHTGTMDGGHVDANVPFGTPPPLWGEAVVRTRALAADKAIVGNWQQGATIFDRMGTTIRSTDSHASLFISNTLVVLAEKREALAVWRPDFFVDVTLNFT